MTAFHQDHPHACGDKYNRNAYTSALPGSSPCVWGQASSIRLSVISSRIIPMRVGTRTPYPTGFRCFWDHPHACVDKCDSIFGSTYAIESSPCVWGQVRESASLSNVSGIIPMRVGTRHSRYKTRYAHEDHPHACGDKLSVMRLIPVI